MTPDNGAYAVAAYSLTALIYLLYGLSLIARERRLRARFEQLNARAGGAPAREA